MAGPSTKVSKAALFKTISFKGSTGAVKKYTPITAAVKLGEVEHSMTTGMGSVVAGINSLGTTLNSIAVNSEAMVTSMKSAVSKQIADNEALIKREEKFKKEEKDRKAKEALERKKRDAKEARDSKEKGSENPLFKKITSVFATGAKKVIGGIFGALGKFAEAFFMYFVGYQALDWITKNPEKIQKLAEGLIALGKFVFNVTGWLTTTALDGIVKFMENPISIKGFFGAVQFVLAAAPLFATLAFLANPIGTVKALSWVIMSLGKGILGLFKAGKSASKLGVFKSSRMAKIATTFAVGGAAFAGAQLDGAGMSESVGAGVGAAGGQMLGAKLGDMAGKATGIPGLGMVGGALGGMVGAPVGKAIGGMIEPLIAPIQRFIGDVGDVFNSVIGAIQEPMTEMFQGIANFMNTALDVIEPHLPLIAKLVGGGLKAVLTPLMWGLKLLTKVLSFFAPKDGGQGTKGGIAEAVPSKAAGGHVVMPKAAPIPQMAEGGSTMDAGPIKLISTSLKRVTKMGAGIGEVMLLPFKAVGVGILSAIGMVGRLFGKFLPGPIKTLLANSLAPIAKAFGVPLSVLGGDVGGKDPKNADEGKEEPNYLKELLEVYTGDQGVLQNFSKLLTVVGGRDMINKGLSVLADWKSRLGFARGGWISGPMSGYPVSLDGGASTSFIGHGTEWVGMKGYAQGGAYVVPFNTPATKMNSGLTSMRMRQAAAGGYALPFSNGGALQTFSEGGKFMSNDQKKAYENGKKHTRHFEVDGAKYAATYTKTANEIVVKGIQKVAKEGGWFGVGQKKPWLSPGGDEYKKIFASEELKYAIAKHAGMRSGPNSRNKHVDPSLITSLISDPDAQKYFLYKTTSKKDRKKLEAEEDKKEPPKTLEAMMLEFAGVVKEINEKGTGSTLDTAQLNADQKKNEKQKAAQEPTVVVDEEEAPPVTTGSAGNSQQDPIILPGSEHYDPDPFLMPKFGLVAEFATDYAEMN